MAGCVTGQLNRQQAYTNAAQSMKAQRTRLAFFALCCYLVSQAVGIPVIAFGPSWAVWPTLSDIAAGILALSALNGFWHYRAASQANNEIFRGLLLILGGTVLVFFFMYLRDTVLSIGGGDKSMTTGMFQIYHLMQFILIFYIASGIPFTDARIKLLSRIVDIVLLIVFACIVGTYFSIISTRLLVSHLPSGEGSGPWSALWSRQMTEVGAVGYNHAYTALQLIMLTSLGLHLRPKASPLAESAYLLMCLAGVVMSGSRAGMAAAVFFIAAHLIRKPATLVTAFVVIVSLSLVAGGVLQSQNVDLDESIGRLMTLQKPLQSDNLSGRDEIWKDSVAFIQEDPLRWVVGAGPGSVAQQGYNAHNLFLQIIMEAGLIGLFIFCSVCNSAVRHLINYETGTKPILYASIAFLLSSFTQETFYPVPALGHFLGLYLCSLAIALRLNISSNNSSNPTIMEARYI